MADDAPASSGASKTPADFLKSIRGKPVIVKLNSGSDYRGEICFFVFQKAISSVDGFISSLTSLFLSLL